MKPMTKTKVINQNNQVANTAGENFKQYLYTSDRYENIPHEAHAYVLAEKNKFCDSLS